MSTDSKPEVSVFVDNAAHWIVCLYLWPAAVMTSGGVRDVWFVTVHMVSVFFSHTVRTAASRTVTMVESIALASASTAVYGVYALLGSINYKDRCILHIYHTITIYLVIRVHVLHPTRT